MTVKVRVVTLGLGLGLGVVDLGCYELGAQRHTEVRVTVRSSSWARAKFTARVRFRVRFKDRSSKG